MQCEHCRKNAARVRIDQMVNGQKKACYLCQSCVDELMNALKQDDGLMNTFKQDDELVNALNQFRESVKKTEENAIPASSVVQSTEQDASNILQQLKTISERLNALDEKFHQLQATSDQQTILLAQVLARLSENASQ